MAYRAATTMVKRGIMVKMRIMGKKMRIMREKRRIMGKMRTRKKNIMTKRTKARKKNIMRKKARRVMAEAVAGPRIDMGQTRYDLEADIDQPFAGIHRIRTRWTYNDYNHNELEASGEVGTSFDNDEVEGRVEIIHNPIGLWQGVFGVQYRNKDFAAVGEESFVLPSKVETIAAFLLEKGDLGNWHMEFGARYEYQETSANAAEDTSHDLFSASGGVSWNYAAGYEAGLTVTHAQRAPSLEEAVRKRPAPGDNDVRDWRYRPGQGEVHQF